MRTLQSELRRLKLAKKKEQLEQAPKKQQKLSKSELEEMMGLRKPRYRRGKGGAYRSY